MTLEEYITSGAGKQAEIAEKTGLSETSIYRIRKGLQNPPLETMGKIAKATNNAVTPNDFAGIAA